jgi:transcriptional regulator with XRE-family HTH domain
MRAFESMAPIKACFPVDYKYALMPGFTLPRMAEYGDRLAEAIRLSKIPEKEARAKLAAKLGVSVQAVGQVLGGTTKALTAENSAKAARFLNVDHYWLATGEGDPRPQGLSEEARAWAARFDKLTAAEKEKFSALLVVARDGVPDAVVEAKMPITRKVAKERS